MQDDTKVISRSFQSQISRFLLYENRINSNLVKKGLRFHEIFFVRQQMRCYPFSAKMKGNIKLINETDSAAGLLYNNIDQQ